MSQNSNGMNKKGSHSVRFSGSQKNRVYPLIGLFILLLIAIGVYFFYDNTFTYQSGSVEAKDNLVIDLPKIQNSGFSVYVGKNAHTVPPEQYIFATTVEPGTYRIIVSASNHWPWKANVVLSEGEKATLHPFLIQKNLADKVNVHRIFNDAKTYGEKNAIIQKENALSRATSSDKSVTLDWSTSKLTATWVGKGAPPTFFCNGDTATTTCPRTKTVLDITKPNFIDADFYGTRNDVIIFGVPTGIFVIDIAGTPDSHNLQPIYEGNVSAMAVQNGTIYLKDAKAKGNIIEITLPNVPGT